MSRRPAIVVDLDGTLASSHWRTPHLTGKRKDWDAFFRGMGRDAPVPWVVELLAADHGHAARLVVSGRPEDYRDVCETWLDRHGISYDELHLRPRGDRRPDTVVKREILDRDLLPRYDVRVVIDDRPGVVQMWRDAGLYVIAPTDPGLSPLHDPS